jgi:hypothetical protein
MIEPETVREVLLGSDRYKRAEQRLEEWAAERDRITRLLGIPVLSSMGVMAAYLRREEEPEEVVRSSAPKKPKRKRRDAPKLSVRKCANDRCGLVHASATCPRCATPRAALTARGAATSSSSPDDAVGFTRTVAEVDGIIATLPGRHKSAIFRAYMYRQPDRIAARELDMPREEFTSMRQRAVITIAEKLAQRVEAAV